MASLTVYATEPATKGKVVLHTTVGALDVELWSKEAPLTCRNFIQLCLEGYYDGCIFHRIIKGFMAQTGDPTGTGTGGDSVYGGDFKDEFHGRLRYTHRGLLGMASSGPNTNRSQFFITLDQCPWIDNKHTVFGKVTGNSLYNLPRFDEQETDKDDRPLYPPRIERVEVLFEPFDDIVPRPKAVAEPADEPKKKKKKEKKNLSLLSFGEEAAAEEQAVEKLAKKVVSSHDVLDDPRLSKQQAVDTAALAAKLRKREVDKSAAAAFKARAQGGSTNQVEEQQRDAGAGDAGAGDAGADDAGADFDQRMRQQMQRRRQRLEEAAQDAAGGADEGEMGGEEGEAEGGREGGAAGGSAGDTQDEYERLRRELVAGRKAEEARQKEGAKTGRVGGWKWRGKGIKDSDDDDEEEEEEEAQGGSVLEQRRAKFLKRKQSTQMLTKKQRQEATLQKLGSFKSSIRAEAGGEDSWKDHKLVFVKESWEAESASRYDSHDPLKHGAEASRVQEKIKAREKVMLSMKQGWEEH